MEYGKSFLPKYETLSARILIQTKGSDLVMPRKKTDIVKVVGSQPTKKKKDSKRKAFTIEVGSQPHFESAFVA